MDRSIIDFLQAGTLPDYKAYLEKKPIVKDILLDGESIVKDGIVTIESNEEIHELYKYCKYLCGVRYDTLDYNYAEKYFKTFKPQGYGVLGRKPFACSSLRVGNFYGRNFDFYYNNDCSFVIRTSKNEGRNATIGVGSYFSKLTDDVVESGKKDDAYKLLPFMIVDGINEHGLFVNTNVVTVEKTPTTGTKPEGEKKGDLCMMMIPRFILDYYKTAKEAVEDIKSHYSVYSYNVEAIRGSELHLMIGDESETYLMEFVDNKVVYEKLGDKHPEIMTNFYTIESNLINGKIDETPENKSGVALLSCGIERYNKLVDGMASVKSVETMHDLMKSIWYTNSYNPEKKLYTEMVGLPDKVETGKILTVETPREHYIPTLESAKKAYENRDRSQGIRGIWHTTHSSVYNIKERKLYLHVQEDEFGDKVYEFELNKKIIIN